MIHARFSDAIDYQPASLAGSRLLFRGPLDDTREAPIVCLGGGETFGRFLEAPFPSLIAKTVGVPVYNLGVMNAGLDVMMDDPAIRGAASRARAIVMQIVGAHNMSNPYYRVHPRYNDRFVKPSTRLRSAFRDVEFNEIHYTRHLLSHLRNRSPHHFKPIRKELAAAWVLKMRSFIKRCKAPVHLIWIATHPPENHQVEHYGHDPLFVTEKMLEQVSELAHSLTIATPRSVAEMGSTAGMHFNPGEEASARLLPGPDVHKRAASALIEHLG